MKKLLWLLAVAIALTLTSFAQDSNMASGQTSTTSKAKTKTKNAAGDMDHDMGGKQMKAKTSTITGCVSASPNADGMYTITNGRYKNGVEVGPTDKVQEHAGHKVAVKGMWSADEKDAGKKMFTVDSLKHLSATCTMAGGMSSKDKSGMKPMKSGKSSKAGTTGAMSSTTPPPTH